jgi:NodT family efflux transporter outer membrane factor (OMF) lipoprotein
LATLLTGCTVGPDFQPETLPDGAGYTREPLTKSETVGADPAVPSQHLVEGGEITAQWWTLFHSPALDALLLKALQANPSLDAARETLAAARETAIAQGASRYPTVGAQVDDSRQKISEATSGLPINDVLYFSLADAQIGVTYSLDLFGGERRAIESADAFARFQRYQLAAATLLLTADLVKAVVQSAAYREQIAATREIIEYQEKLSTLAERQFAVGGAARNDVLLQQAAVAATKASLPPLQKLLDQSRNRIATLSGAFPNSEDEAAFTLSSFVLPGELPVSLPSALLRQRPDILSAEEQVHQASALVGVAVANQYPQISLSAILDRQSLGLTNLFPNSVTVANATGTITQPIFDGGRLEHQRHAAEAQLRGAEANYRQIVLGAFADVADVLQSLSWDADTLKAQKAAEQTAAMSLDLAQRQYAVGSVEAPILYNAEQAYVRARLAAIQAQADRYIDSVALLVALGGGWWSESTEAPKDVQAK